MSTRIQVRCDRSSRQEGGNSFLLRFSVSTRSDSENRDLFENSPHGRIEFVGVSEEVASKYKEGEFYNLDLLQIVRSPPSQG